MLATAGSGGFFKRHLLVELFVNTALCYRHAMNASALGAVTGRSVITHSARVFMLTATTWKSPSGASGVSSLILEGGDVPPTTPKHTLGCGFA
jgi:hypothetical protein